jgi:hypothetical protein
MDPPTDNTSEKLQRQLAEGPIKQAILLGWLKGAGDATVKLTRSPAQGATNAIIMRAEVTLDFHVKFDVDAVKKEREGYEILARSERYRGHLVPPLFQELVDTMPSASVVMLVPFEKAIRFADLVGEGRASDDMIKRSHRDFLDVNSDLWRSTLTTARVNLLNVYWRRVRERRDQLAERIGLESLDGVELVVNGESYGEMGLLFERMRERLERVSRPQGCTSHGDENATNVMVPHEAYEYGHHSDWLIVDYVNTGEQNDWIFSIAKMLQDWRFDQVLRMAAINEDIRLALAGRWEVDGSRLVLSYNTGSLAACAPPVCQELEEMTLRLAEEFAAECGESDWRDRLELACSAVTFGSVPLRMVADPFSLPVLLDHAMQPLLA